MTLSVHVLGRVGHGQLDLAPQPVRQLQPIADLDRLPQARQGQLGRRWDRLSPTRIVEHFFGKLTDHELVNDLGKGPKIRPALDRLIGASGSV